MNAKLSIEMTALPDGAHQASVEISASNKDLIMAYVALSKAVATKLGTSVPVLAAALAGTASIVDAPIRTEAAIDVGAILRMQGGGEGDAADR